MIIKKGGQDRVWVVFFVQKNDRPSFVMPTTALHKSRSIINFSFIHRHRSQGSHRAFQQLMP